MFWDLSRLGTWNQWKQEVTDAEEAEAEGRDTVVNPVAAPGWMPVRKQQRMKTVMEGGTGSSSVNVVGSYRAVGGGGGQATGSRASSVTGRTSGRLGTGTSASPDPETLLSGSASASASAGASTGGNGSGRPSSRPGSRGSTTTSITNVTTATGTTATNLATNTTASGTTDTANKPLPGIGLGGYSQKQIDDWNEQCDITDSHNEIKPHKTVTVDPKGQHFVGRQVAWSPEGDWCVVVGNTNRAMIFQRWGR